MGGRWYRCAEEGLIVARSMTYFQASFGMKYIKQVIGIGESSLSYRVPTTAF